MTTEAQTQDAKPTDAKPADAESKAPAVDVDAIREEAKKAAIEEAQEAAKKAADARMKELFKKAAGEEDKEPPVDPEAIEMLRNPKGYRQKVVAEAEQAIKESKARTDAMAKKAEDIAKPYFENSPQIAKHLDYVDAIAVKKMSEGKGFEDAIKEAFKEAVEKLEIPTVTEEQRRQRAAAATVPGMGGSGYPQSAPAFDDKKSQEDFITGMRNRVKSFKTKK